MSKGIARSSTSPGAGAGWTPSAEGASRSSQGARADRVERRPAEASSSGSSLRVRLVLFDLIAERVALVRVLEAVLELAARIDSLEVLESRAHVGRGGGDGRRYRRRELGGSAVGVDRLANGFDLRPQRPRQALQ